MVPIYPWAAVHEPVRLFQGEVVIAVGGGDDDPVDGLASLSGETLRGQGSVQLKFLPKPKVIAEFATEQTATALHAMFSAERNERFIPPTIEQLQFPPEATALVASDADGVHFEEEFPNSEIGEGSGLSALVFHLVNWTPDLAHEIVSDGPGTASRGRFELAASGWKMVIDERPDLNEVRRDMRAAGGYALTHLCRLTREDGRPFGVEDAGIVLDAWWHFASFVRGAATGSALMIGMDGSGEPNYAHWTPRRSDPWGWRPTWYPEHQPQVLHQLWPAFLDLYRDEYWRQVLRRSVSYYIDANGEKSDRGLILAASALEVLGWAVLVIEGTNNEKELQADAALALRELLDWAAVGLDLPLQDTALLAEARQLKRDGVQDADGPRLVTWVRNKLVHPDHKHRVTSWHIHEARELALWYVERVLLCRLGYAGPYAPRLTRFRHAGDVEHVPWSTSGQDDS